MNISGKKGFSLIELMVAIGILSIGMAAVSSMIYQTFQSERHSAKQRRAHIVATQIVERFKGGNPPTSPPTTPAKLPEDGDGVIVGGELVWQDLSATDGTFFCRWNTKKFSGFKTIDVLVGWGSTNCSRTSVDTCPRKLRIVSVENNS